MKIEKQKYFWEKAGDIGYVNLMFRNKLVEEKILKRQWQIVTDIGKNLGLNENSRILELGCGDGAFAENILAVNFKHIDAFDYSESSIKRAKSLSKSNNVSYLVKDIRELEFDKNSKYDGAFLMGFLHHVKPFAPLIVERLSKICTRVVISDPNGDSIIRRMFEMLPFYKKSGEDSFKLQELIDTFKKAGYQYKIIKKICFIPPFLPLTGIIYQYFNKIESIVEQNSFLSRLCAINILGLEHISEDDDIK